MVLKEDCPLRVSEETVNRPQLKACGKPAESRVDSEANDNMHPRQDVQICIPNWKCPPNVAMDCSWHVAAAEESQEVKVQNIREASVLEACYPRPSAIPPNPSVAPDASSGHLDDSQVPAIPLRGIEEEEGEMPQATMEPENLDTPQSDASVPLELPTITEPDIAALGVGLDADAAAAATAAYRATLKWKQQGSLIDPDLLIRIVSNPDMIRKLVDERGLSVDALNGRKIDEPSSSGSGPLTGLKMVTRGSTDEPSLPGTVGVVPFSWTPSEPFRWSVAIAPGTGPAPRPDIPRASLNCVAPHSAPRGVCPIPPSVATAPGIGPFPRPDFSRASFQCVRPPYVSAIPRPSLPCAPPHGAAPHTVRSMAPSVAMTAGTGTPQNAPSMAITAPATKDMEYLKSLIRKHGSGQETLRIDQVEVGKPGPVTSIQPQPQPTSSKPNCKFFNTPRGCRNGVSCRFQHVLENHPNVVRLLQDAPDAKKMKLTGEFGTNK